MSARPKLITQFSLVDKDGRPTQLFRDWLQAIDNGVLPNLTNAANDAAAQAAGVPVQAMYRNGSVLMVRVS